MMRATIVYHRSPEVVVKEFHASLKPTLGEAGTRWHAKTLPGHFTTAAERLYNYQPRKKSYAIAKAKRYHHRNPLVKTGRSRDMMLRAARITTTAKGARVRMQAPPYWHKYRKDLGQADKAAEATATTTGEVQSIAQFVHDRMTSRMNAARGGGTVQ